MPAPRAEVGQRWLIRNLHGPKKHGWRVIRWKRRDRHGRLYGICHPDGEFPLTPVTAEGPRGRYVRSRSLIKRDRRIRRSNLNVEAARQDAREAPQTVICEQRLTSPVYGQQGASQ